MPRIALRVPLPDAARRSSLDDVPGSDSIVELGHLLRDARRFLHERFDRHGRVLTRLPEMKEQEPGQKLPAVTLQDAQITLRQEGDREHKARSMTVSGADLQVEDQPSGMAVGLLTLGRRLGLHRRGWRRG